MDNDFFGIYDESFDLDRDGKLDASELDYMLEEYEKARSSTNLGEDNSDLFDDEDEDEDDWDDDEDSDDDCDDDEDDAWEDSEDEDDWDDSDDWDDEPDD